MNYKEIGLKAGLEIHFQLSTKHKLFCNCSTEMKEKEPSYIVMRYQHPVQSETGEVDIAAQYEYLKKRKFYYEFFKNESCLVELDEEPPHEMNLEALETAIKVALLMNCKIPDEIQVMRKIVIDGSNPSGFQRTAIVGYDGWIEYKGTKIPITQISLEEDAAAKDREEDGSVYYKLNRLGIPLIEIDTGILEGFTPTEIEEIANKIGSIVFSTRKVRKAIGAIRQDVNVSIEKGARVEIKGVQRLGLIAKVIENEVNRQMKIIEEGGKVENETRGAKEDGTTFFMRPLPGSGRMYPETDVPPIQTSEIIKKAKKNLPETIDKIVERFKTKYKLSNELVNSLMKTNYFFDFDYIVKKSGADPKFISNVLSSVMKDLKRKENIDTDVIGNEALIDMFKAFSEGKILKENIPEIIKFLSQNPDSNVYEAIGKLGIKLLSTSEIDKIIDDAIKETKEFKKVVAIVMPQIRGKADPKKVIERIKKKLS